MTVEWDAEIIDEMPEQLIAWRSLDGADVDNAGSVRFQRAPGAEAPSARPAAVRAARRQARRWHCAWLFGEEPRQQIREDLRRFKQLLRPARFPLSDGQPPWRGAKPVRT